mgnify:CR=1 FL=1
MDLFSAKNTPTSVRGASIAYRPELDGIRGFAVIIIIFHHFNYIDVQYFAGRGFLGVDIFFAIRSISYYFFSTVIITGTWSLGFSPLRALRSISEDLTRLANDFVANKKSILIPSPL